MRRIEIKLTRPQFIQTVDAGMQMQIWAARWTNWASDVNLSSLLKTDPALSPLHFPLFTTSVSLCLRVSPPEPFFLLCRPEAERWPCLSVSTSLNGQVPLNRVFPHSAQIICLGVSFQPPGAVHTYKWHSSDCQTRSHNADWVAIKSVCVSELEPVGKGWFTRAIIITGIMST